MRVTAAGLYAHPVYKDGSISAIPTGAPFTPRPEGRGFSGAKLGEGPSFAKFKVNHRFIAQLRQLKALCEEQGLTEVRVTAEPDLWGGCDEDSLRLRCEELVVAGGSFWFNAHPKHMDYDIQTRWKSIDSFIDMVTGDGPQERFFDGIEDEVAAQDPADILDEDDDPMPSGHRDISDNDPGPVRNHAPHI